MQGRKARERSYLLRNEGGGGVAPEASQVEAAGTFLVPGHHASFQEHSGFSAGEIIAVFLSL